MKLYIGYMIDPYHLDQEWVEVRYIGQHTDPIEFFQVVVMYTIPFFFVDDFISNMSQEL